MLDTFIPYTITVPTAYGTMLVNRHDINQTGALVKQGIAVDFGEILIVKKLLDVTPAAHKVFIDVGANVGTHTLAIAQHLKQNGTVHAFEPQRIMFQMICGSLALNSVVNTHCHNMAVGGSSGRIKVPQFDYFKPLNFGSIEFGGAQKERLHQEPGQDVTRTEFVTQVTLDSFEWPEVHVIKIDAEGMEFAILEGARETIARCAPYLLVEYLKVDKAELASRLKGFGYRLYDIGINYLAVPPHAQAHLTIEGLPEV